MNKDFIASIIFAISCFLFFYLAVPQYDLLLDARAAIKDRQVILDERKAMSANFKDLYSQLQQRSADIERLAVLLPEKPHEDEIISGIQQAVIESGLQLGSVAISPERETTTVQYQKVGIIVDISGNLTGLTDLLQRLENSLRVYDVIGISISKDRLTGLNFSNYIMEVKIMAYYSK